MNGLGYGLVNKEGSIYYNCNYKGYSWQMVAPASEYQTYTYTIQDYDSYDNKGNPVGDPIDIAMEKLVYINVPTTEATIIDYFNTNISDSTEYIEWCLSNFLGEVPSLVVQELRADLYGVTMCEVWEYSNNIFIHKSLETYKFQAAVWANSNVDEATVDYLISRDDSENETPVLNNKIEKIEYYINKFGTEAGFYSKICTAPDGKIVVKL